MKEKLKTLSLAELKELAKAQGLKGISSMRKQQLIDWLAERWETEVKKQQEQKETKTEKETPKTEILKPEAPKAEAPKAEAPKEESRKPAEPAAAEKSAEPAAAVRTGNAGQTARTERRREERRPQQQTPAPQTRPMQAAPAPQARPMQAAPAPKPVPAQADAADPLAHLPEELQGAADRDSFASGILEVMPDGFGFLRSENYLSGDNDVYVSPSQIRRFNLRTGDIVTGVRRIKTEKEKFAALLYVNTVNGKRPMDMQRRVNFEDMTPIFPDERIHLAVPGASTAMRIVDLISPIGKGQRGMIVSPPKAGKTTLLKQVAKTITDTMPDMHLIILLIDERPEEVTDFKEYIEGPQVEVIYSTFDREPEQHKRVSEMVIERARRLVEQHRDVTILLDSITRLARAYNLTVMPSGRTLSGGLDPAALYMPKRFFGAARNMREGGSLTILATALVDTGSRMDDVVYEEFKGTGNMELVLDRKLQERRVFPAVDILKSGTRRDDLLLSREERDALDIIHRATAGGASRQEDGVERVLDLFAKTRDNNELVYTVRMNRRI